jgi:hypothetical protein
MRSGPFAGLAKIQAKPDGGDSESYELLELPISGRVYRRLAVYGEGIDSNGSLDLGFVQPGEGRQRRLALRVRDRETNLVLKRAEIDPEFIQVSLTPHETSADVKLYHLDITVPRDAPKCVYRGMRPGKMKLFFDHPRIEDLTLDLYLAVMPRP